MAIDFDDMGKGGYKISPDSLSSNGMTPAEKRNSIGKLVLQKWTGTFRPEEKQEEQQKRKGKTFTVDDVEYSSHTHIVYADILKQYLGKDFDPKQDYKVSLTGEKQFTVHFSLERNPPGQGQIHFDIRHGFSTRNWKEDLEPTKLRDIRKAGFVEQRGDDDIYVIVGNPSQFYREVLSKLVRPSKLISEERFVQEFVGRARRVLRKNGLIKPSPGPKRNKYNKRRGDIGKKRQDSRGGRYVNNPGASSLKR